MYPRIGSDWSFDKNDVNENGNAFGVVVEVFIVFRSILQLQLMLSLGARRHPRGFHSKSLKKQPSGSEISLIFIGPSAHRGSIICIFLQGAKCIRA